MNRSQYLAAIKAIFPGMTARFADGEFRVSLSIETIKAAYPDASHAEAMARNESLAAYEMDGDSALATAKALAASWKAEIADKAAPQVIDCTPTWAEIVNVYVACLEDGTPAGRAAAIKEIRHMATLADQRNDFAKELAAIKAALDSDASPHGRLAAIRAVVESN